MAASAGSTGALVTTGVADIVGSYAMATGAASSGSAFLSSLAAGVSISPAGALVLTAAAVVAIGALVAWYVGENGLDEPGDAVTMIPGISDGCSYGGLFLPNIESVWTNKVIYPHAMIIHNSYYDKKMLILYQDQLFFRNSSSLRAVDGTFIREVFLLDDGTWVFDHSSTDGAGGISYVEDFYWTTLDFLAADKISVLLAASDFEGGDIQNQFDVTRSFEFSQPDTEFQSESQKQMVIDLGFTPGITLDEVVELVPEQIAAGTLEPTYQIIINEPGEGTEEEPEPELQPEVVPLLQSIKTTLISIPTLIADSVMDGLQTMFVPSEVYMESLPEHITDTFEERTGFLTYPFSLLPDFVGRLSAPSDDWILKWPQIEEPFTGAILFQQGSWNVTAFVQANAQIKRLYDLWRLIAKAIMSFGFLGLCYNKYRSVVGDHYGEG